MLLDTWLGFARIELRHDAPLVAPAFESVVSVLHPDHGHMLTTRLVDQRRDLGDDLVARVCSRDDGVLHVDDEQGGVGPVLERAHAGRPTAAGPARKPRSQAAGIDGIWRSLTRSVPVRDICPEYRRGSGPDRQMSADL